MKSLLTLHRSPTPLMDASALADVARMRIRLEGYGSYSVVAALVLNAALRLLTSTDLDLNKLAPKGKVAPSDRVLQMAFLMSIAMCVFGGAYVSLIYALCSTYAKTALGYGLDGQAAVFLAVTRGARTHGFFAYVTMLVGFVISFPLSVYFKVLKQEATLTDPAVVRRNAQRGLCLCGLICLLIFGEWFTIIMQAGEHVYKPLHGMLRGDMPRGS